MATQGNRPCDERFDWTLNAPCGTIERVEDKENCFKLILPIRETNVVGFRRNRFRQSAIAERWGLSEFAALWSNSGGFALDNPNATLSVKGEESVGIVIVSVSDVRQPGNPSVGAKKKFMTIVFYLGPNQGGTSLASCDVGFVVLCGDGGEDATHRSEHRVNS